MGFRTRSKLFCWSASLNPGFTKNILILFLIVFGIASCKCAKKNCGGDLLNGYSGMAQVDESSYIVVHDYKSHQKGPRFGLVKFEKDKNYIYRTLPISNLNKNTAPPGDLESISSIPKSNQEFLAAESGYWNKTNGRIFHIQIENNRVKIIKILNLPFTADNNKQEEGDNFEGLACASLDDTRVLLILGERGGSPRYPRGILRWGTYNLFDQKLTWDNKENTTLTIRSPRDRAHFKRDTSDLFIDDEKNLWAVATGDAGNNGPFRSVIYKIGTIDISQRVPVKINQRPKEEWIIDGFKIETIARPPKFIPGSSIMIGTEDENYGGVIRPLLKSQF